MSPKTFQQIVYWPIFATLKLFFNFQIYGRENIKGLENKPVIFASNHANRIDGVICGMALPRNSFVPQKFFPIRFLADHQFCNWEKSPFPFPLSILSADFVNMAGSIPVISGTKQPLDVVLAEPIKVLKNDGKFWIFPEGRMTRDGKLQPGKRGAVFIHQKTDAILVPVGLINSYKMFSLRNLINFLFKKKKLELKFGKPINLKSESVETGTEKLMAEIARLIS